MDGVELEIRPSALRAIARKALARKTGARGLRSIMEQSLIDTMFELPTLDGVAKVVVDEHTIEEEAKPLLVYREAGQGQRLSRRCRRRFARVRRAASAVGASCNRPLGPYIGSRKRGSQCPDIPSCPPSRSRCRCCRCATWSCSRTW